MKNGLEWIPNLLLLSRGNTFWVLIVVDCFISCTFGDMHTKGTEPRDLSNKCCTHTLTFQFPFINLSTIYDPTFPLQSSVSRSLFRELTLTTCRGIPLSHQHCLHLCVVVRLVNEYELQSQFGMLWLHAFHCV